MFGRKIRTRLPCTRTTNNKSVDLARENDQKAKEVQKRYKDAKPYVKEHNIQVGDQVLLKQKKTKCHTAYDPEPFIVTEVNGHQVTADKHERALTRDAQKWKRIETRSRPDYAKEERDMGLLEEESEENSDVPESETQLAQQETQSAASPVNVTPDPDSPGPIGQDPGVDEIAAAPTNDHQQRRRSGRPRGSRKRRGFRGSTARRHGTGTQVVEEEDNM